jgi:tetratricopeptide (TPR) repeat protein
MDKRPRLETVAVAAVVAIVIGGATVLWRSLAAEAAGERGMTAHANLRYDDALAEYARASELAPGDWRWQYYRALVLMERGEAAGAANSLRLVLRQQPELAIAWWRLAEAEFKQTHFAEAAAAYQRAEGDSLIGPYARAGRDRAEHKAVERARPSVPPRDPMIDALADISTNAVFLIRNASSIDLARDPRRREYLVRRALETNPNDPDVVYEMGSLLQQLHRPVEALPYFTRHLDLVDDDQQTLVQIGKCYSDLGRLEEAEATLARALALGDDAIGYYNLGFVLEERGREADAERAYRRAVDLGPGLSRARSNLGALLARSGRAGEAKPLLTEAIRLEPSSPDAYNNMAALLLDENAPAEAAKYARLALDADPRHVDAHVNLGVALARAGDLDAARGEFEAALRIDPRHEAARRNLAAIAR